MVKFLPFSTCLSSKKDNLTPLSFTSFGKVMNLSPNLGPQIVVFVKIFAVSKFETNNFHSKSSLLKQKLYLAFKLYESPRVFHLFLRIN